MTHAAFARSMVWWEHVAAPTRRRMAMHITVLIAAGLWLDARYGWVGQHAATLWTLVVWCALFRLARTVERRMLILCTLIAAVGEIFLSLAWRLYDYQFGNVPLFVPPGHALLMTLGLLAVRAVPPAAVRYLVLAVSAGALIWAVMAWSRDTDRFGVVLALLYGTCLAVGRDRPLYAAMFVLALIMEIYGTILGNWRWQPVVPGWQLTAANPPFSAGAFYCALDLLVLAALRAWQAISPYERERLSAVLGDNAPHGERDA